MMITKIFTDYARRPVKNDSMIYTGLLEGKKP